MLKILLFILIFLITNQVKANISISAQQKLINNKIIYEGLACNELTSLLGGLNKIDLLWLGNKKGEINISPFLNMD